MTKNTEAQKTECGACKDHGKNEWFNYLWGAFVWNVSKAWKLIEEQGADATNLVIDERVKGLVDYPPNKESVDITKRLVDVDHLDHVDPVTHSNRTT